jgi:hypothetical protein
MEEDQGRGFLRTGTDPMGFQLHLGKGPRISPSGPSRG